MNLYDYSRSMKFRGFQFSFVVGGKMDFKAEIWYGEQIQYCESVDL